MYKMLVISGYGGVGVEVVQEDGGLHAGEGVQAPPVAPGVGARVLDHRDLTGQGRSDGGVVEERGARRVGGAQGDVALQVGAGRQDVAGQVADDAERRDRGGGQGVGAAHAPVDDRRTAVGRGDQAQGQAGAGDGLAGVGDDVAAVHPHGQQGQRPGQEVGGHPVGALLLAAGHGREGGGVEREGDRVGEGHGTGAHSTGGGARAPARPAGCGPVVSATGSARPASRDAGSAGRDRAPWGRWGRAGEGGGSAQDRSA